MIEFLAYMLSAILFAIAGIHAYWGTGGLWPANSELALVHTVIGQARKTRMPPAWLTFIVAGMVGLIALWPLVWLHADLPELFGPIFTLAGWGATAIFLLRGIAGYLPFWRAIHDAQPFTRLDQRAFSPLCLLIAGDFVVLLAQ